MDDATHNNVSESKGIIEIRLDGFKMREVRPEVRFEQGWILAMICKSDDHADKGAEFVHVRVVLGDDMTRVWVESKSPILMAAVKSLTTDMAEDVVHNLLISAILEVLSKSNSGYLHRFLSLYGRIQKDKGIREIQFKMQSALGLE